ncbi:hypothetical protein Pmani_019395 [Petrolisthes manimaculis]|uniref:Uncharacterized protein n=1 Tax=Petrolisthes manimaculis TaxID=1843537 RepID=A0AAE1U3K5_9EUCA|nr:hypothetical protein Pmani_019395 [Petrolisthes manimaculis]
MPCLPSPATQTRLRPSSRSNGSTAHAAGVSALPMPPVLCGGDGAAGLTPHSTTSPILTTDHLVLARTLIILPSPSQPPPHPHPTPHTLTTCPQHSPLHQLAARVQAGNQFQECLL